MGNYTNIDPKYYLRSLYEREHQGQIGVRSGSTKIRTTRMMMLTTKMRTTRMMTTI